MADDFDFSDLPAVKAQNTATVIEAGIDPEPPVAVDPNIVLLDETDLADLGTELELEAKYGDSPLSAAALSAADMATFSLSGRALDAAGLVDKETQKQLRERNPEADVAGQIAGAVAPALVTGGASAAAQGAKALSVPVKAGLLTEKVVAKALTKAVAESGSKKLAQSVISKGVQKAAEQGLLKTATSKAAGGAVEGSLMGLSQLLREENLGDAELNAENLMATVGTGALYGGLIGGTIPVAGSALSAGAGKVGKAGKTIFDKVIAKYADPKKAAEELTGMPLGALAKLENKAYGKQLLKDLPDWYANEVKIGIGDTAEEILEKVNMVKSEAGIKIGKVLEQADLEAAQSMKPLPTDLRNRLFSEVADSLDNDFLKPLQTGLAKDTMKAEARQVQNIIKGLRSEAATGAPINAQALVAAKRGVDKILKKFRNRPIGTTATDAELAALEARNMLNEASKRYVSHINPQLAEELAKANRNYSIATTVQPHLLKKSLKDPSMLGFRDALYGLAGIGVGGGPVGAAAVIGKKFLESDLRRKLLILSGMEKANLQIGARIAESASNFVNSAARPARLASIGALVASPIAQKREDGKRPVEPKNRSEAYKNASKNISELIVKSDELMDRSVKAGAAVAYAAPNTAQVIGNRAISGLQFLQSKIPKRPYEAIFPSENVKPYEPSSMELAKFENYVQVVDNPLSVLQDMQSGTLTQAHVEALRAVYPRLYSEIKQSVLKELQTKPETEVPYSKKAQFTILFGTPLDASLIGRNIMGLQAQFATEREQERTGAQGGSAPRSKVDPTEAATRDASDTQAFLARRNSE